MMNNPFEPVGVYEGDEYVGRIGRPSNIEQELREHGKSMRDKICNELHHRGMSCDSRQRYVRDRNNRVVL